MPIALSKHIPVLYPGLLEKWVEPARQFREIVAGHLGIEVVLQVVGEFEKKRGDHPASQRMCLRQRGISVIFVGKINGEQWIHPASRNCQDCIEKDARRDVPQENAAGDDAEQGKFLSNHPGALP